MRSRYALFSIVIALIMVFISSCQTTITSANSDFTPQRLAAVNCSYGGLLSAVEAVDASTVRFTLCSPDPSFPAKLANPAFAILDQDYLNSKQGASKDITLQPVGTGPYTLDLYTSDAITLKANPQYWGVPVKSGTTVVRWNADPFGRYSSLEDKSADLVNNPDPKFYSSIQANSNYQLETYSTYTLYYLGFNSTIPPFDNVKVRQGLAQFLDRTSLILNIFPEGSTVADQMVPKTLTPGFTANMKWYPLDPATALTTLNAEYKDRGKVVNFYYEAAEAGVYPNTSALAFYISNKLTKDLHFSVKVIPLEKDVFDQDLKTGKLGIFLAKFSPQYADPSAYYDYLFVQNAVSFGNINANLISEIKAAEKSETSTIRQGHYDIVNQLIRDQVPLIPIGFVSGAVANNVSDENVINGPFNLNIPEITTPASTITLMQAAAPFSLNPLDEFDPDTFRVTNLIFDTLVTYRYGGTDVQPSLADSWSANSDLTQWTFTLHYGVNFSNGAALDANDVVATFSSLWDIKSPNHIGRTGDFTVFKYVFGHFLNEPAQ